MKVGRRSSLDEFRPSTWEDFAAQVGVAPPFVRRRAVALATMTVDRVDEVAGRLSEEGFGGAELDGFADVIRTRARRVLELEHARRAPS